MSAGQATWTIATCAGLAVVLAASTSSYSVIRLAGAAYLVYLGVHSLVRTLRRPDAYRLVAPAPDARLPIRTAFLQGLFSNLSNPKMVAFFIGLLPPFAGPHPTLAVTLALGLNFCLLTLAWLVGYAFAVERMEALLRRSPIRRAIDGLLGLVLIALGLRVASDALASA